jgi:hypothetical protein
MIISKRLIIYFQILYNFLLKNYLFLTQERNENFRNSSDYKIYFLSILHYNYRISYKNEKKTETEQNPVNIENL